MTVTVYLRGQPQTRVRAHLKQVSAPISCLESVELLLQYCNLQMDRKKQKRKSQGMILTLWKRRDLLAVQYCARMAVRSLSHSFSVPGLSTSHYAAHAIPFSGSGIYTLCVPVLFLQIESCGSTGSTSFYFWWFQLPTRPSWRCWRKLSVFSFHVFWKDQNPKSMWSPRCSQTAKAEYLLNSCK